MPRLYLAEMACDIKARSEEFGTDLRQWVDEVATKKYMFMKDGQVYKELSEFIDLLCPTPFGDLSK